MRSVRAFICWVLKQEILKTKEVEFGYWSTGGFTSEVFEKIKAAESDLPSALSKKKFLIKRHR